MRIVGVVTVCLLLLTLIGAPNGEAQSLGDADYWMIARGQGGCSSVSAVKGDLHDLAPWSNPEDFVNGLRDKGIEVSTVTGEFKGRYLVKVLVPSRRVDVVFLPYSLCRIMWQEELERQEQRSGPTKR